MSTDSKESLEQRKRRINITIHKPQESVVPTIPRTSLRKILIQKKPGVNPYKEQEKAKGGKSMNSGEFGGWKTSRSRALSNEIDELKGKVPKIKSSQESELQ